MIKDPRKRKKILQEGKKNGDIAGLCKKYGISRSTYYRWKERLNAGESLADKSKRPKKVRKATDHAIEKAIVELKENNPKLSTRDVKVKGLEGRFVSNATVWKIWKKHGFEIRKVIPVEEIIDKIRNKEETLTEKEKKTLTKNSSLYTNYGDFLETERGVKLMGVRFGAQGPLYRFQPLDPSSVLPLVHVLMDCETLVAFVTVGDKNTITKNATRLLQHILSLMARKGRVIKKIEDSPDRYEIDRLESFHVEFSGSSSEGERLLDFLWSNNGGKWDSNLEELRRSERTGHFLGVVRFVREKNRTKIEGYPLMGKSPLAAWRRLKR